MPCHYPHKYCRHIPVYNFKPNEDYKRPYLDARVVECYTQVKFTDHGANKFYRKAPKCVCQEGIPPCVTNQRVYPLQTMKGIQDERSKHLLNNWLIVEKIVKNLSNEDLQGGALLNQIFSELCVRESIRRLGVFSFTQVTTYHCPLDLNWETNCHHLARSRLRKMLRAIKTPLQVLLYICTIDSLEIDHAVYGERRAGKYSVCFYPRSAKGNWSNAGFFEIVEALDQNECLSAQVSCNVVISTPRFTDKPNTINISSRDAFVAVAIPQQEGVEFLPFFLEHRKDFDWEFNRTNPNSEGKAVKGVIMFLEEEFMNLLEFYNEYVKHNISHVTHVMGASANYHHATTVHGWKSHGKEWRPMMGWYVCGDNVEFHTMLIYDNNNLNFRMNDFRKRILQETEREGRTAKRFILYFGGYQLIDDYSDYVCKSEIKLINEVFPESPVYGLMSNVIYSTQASPGIDRNNVPYYKSLRKLTLKYASVIGVVTLYD